MGDSSTPAQSTAIFPAYAIEKLQQRMVETGWEMADADESQQFGSLVWPPYLPLLAKNVCNILLLFSCLATS